MKKYLLVIEIKPDFADEYIDIHKNPWNDMLLAIKNAGYTKEVIFFYKNQSIIYLECPDDLDHSTCNTILRSTDVCKKWDIKVCPWFASEPVMCEKIFDVEQQLEGQLLSN